MATLRGNLWAYLQDRNSWTDVVISSIDWKAFKQANSNGAFFHHRIALVKHFHSISPMGKLANRNDPSQPAACPAAVIFRSKTRIM
jgi:hypothetical protein